MGEKKALLFPFSFVIQLLSQSSIVQPQDMEYKDEKLITYKKNNYIQTLLL